MNVAHEKTTGWRGSEDLWLDAAYRLFILSGPDAVKIMSLAKSLGLSRTSFYWHFESRDALIAALLEKWRSKNTDSLVAATLKPAHTITEAVLHLFDCWLDPGLFDARMDYAMRSLSAEKSGIAGGIQEDIQQADRERLQAIAAMYRRFGYDALDADIRAHTLYLTQLGYIMARIDEDLETRLRRIPAYLVSFTGYHALSDEIVRFETRNREKLY